MFATLLGDLPSPPLLDDASPEARLEAVLAAQIEQGLDPLTIAGHPTAADPVEAWRVAAAMTPGRIIKGVVTGPMSSERPAAEVRTTIAALADAGCRWIEVHEPAATSIDDDAGRARFGDVHAAMTDGLDGVHLSLVILGGDASALGVEPILAGRYASLAVDLIRGPDNWRLVVAWPGDRGVVAGALSPRAGSDDGPELLLWAVGYAASTSGRGPTRVGLATAGSLAELPWDVAVRKLERLGRAGQLAQAPVEERRSSIDPRAVDKRSAALGRYDPPSRRPRRRSPGG
jgi:methionine synthase II (cobalamin-independent)